VKRPVCPNIYSIFQFSERDRDAITFWWRHHVNRVKFRNHAVNNNIKRRDNVRTITLG
jgi:hypothetical protein